MPNFRRTAFAGLLLSSLTLLDPALALTGKVVNAETQAPIGGATVSLGEQSTTTDRNGDFDIPGSSGLVRIRTPGFLRLDTMIPSEAAEDGKPIALTPFEPRALYLSIHGIASSKLREGVLDLIRQKNANALVIDVKNDRGEVPFKVAVPWAEQIGAQKLITVHDMKGLLADFKSQGIYTIARIAVFKDDLLAAGHPELAVRVQGGGFFRDRERMRWVDPFRRAVWDYDIAIAKEAAEAGFDEIQFDYVRFPDSKRGVFAQAADGDSRTEAITGFLLAAHQALQPWNVFTAANIFGYVCWNENDTDIGQKIDHIVTAVDIISPMLYPSGFRYGISGVRNPVQHPDEIVYHSLRRCQERTGAAATRFRPWLQAFRDYAFGGRVFDGAAVNAQVKAAAAFGTGSYMLWNPRNVYPKDGYTP